MLDTLASTVLSIQLSDNEPAKAPVLAPAPLTAMAAICTSRPGGSAVGWAKVALTSMATTGGGGRVVDRCGVGVSDVVDGDGRGPGAACRPGWRRYYPPAWRSTPYRSPGPPAARRRSLTEGVPPLPTPPLAAMWASTVLVMKLIAKEPPKALPLPEPAPPTTTLMSCAVSVALIFTAPPDLTVAP